MVVTCRPAQSLTATVQGWNSSPSRWLVQARQTPTPQPYLGPVTPSLSRSTQSSGMSSGASTLTGRPLRTKVWLGMARRPLRS
jgi:hypothetical protein